MAWSKNSPLLTESDLEALTGYRRPSDQVRALQRMGIRHVIRPDGRPRVTWGMLEGRNSEPEYTLNL